MRDTAEIIAAPKVMDILGAFLTAVLIEGGVQQPHAKRIAISYIDRIATGAPHQPTIDMVSAVASTVLDLEYPLTEEEMKTGYACGFGVDGDMAIHFGPEQGDELTLIDGGSVVIIAEQTTKAKIIAAALLTMRARA